MATTTATSGGLQQASSEPSKTRVTRHRAATTASSTTRRVPPVIAVPHVSSRQSLSFSTSTSLSSSVLLTLSQAEALTLAVQLSTSSLLSSRYHLIHHLLLPLTRRWARKLRGAGDAGAPLDEADTAEEGRERDERKEKGRAEGKESKEEGEGADGGGEAEVVEPLQSFLSTSIGVLLTALPLWLDSPSHLHLLDFVAELTTSIPTATPLLLSSLQALLAPGNKPASLLRYEKELLALADAVVLCLSVLPAASLTRFDAVVSPLVTATLSMLQRVLEGNHRRYQHRVARVVQRLLFYHPQLGDAMLASVASPALLLVGRVVMGAVPAQVLRAHMKPLLAVYEQAVLSSKDAAFVALHQTAFTPLLPLLSEADVGALMPSIDRMGKRNPESILPSLATLLSSLTVDLSLHHKLLLPLLLAELKHGEEERRRTAQHVLAALVRNTRDPAALSALLASLVSHLQGKSGTLSQWQLRSSFLSAIGSLSLSSLSSHDTAALSAASVDALTDFLDKEPSSDARTTGVDALTSHLPHLPALSDKVQKHLTTGVSRVKDGNSVPAYLILLIDAIEGGTVTPTLCSSLDGVVSRAVDVLAGHIKAAAAKPLQHRREGLLSIALLLSPSAPASKVWLPLLRDGTSFANSPDLITSCTADDCSAYIRMLRGLFRHHTDLLTPELSALFQTVMRLCVHKQWTVRKQALRWLRSESLDERVLSGLLKGLEAVVNGKGGDAVGSALYARVLLAVFPKAALPAPSIPSLLALASDPLVCPTSALCRQAIRHLHAQQPSLQEQLQSQSSALLSHLNFASSARHQQAASSLLIALQSSFPSFTLSTLLPPTLTFLSPPLLTSLTPYDTSVYHTPDGELCTAKRDGDVHLSSSSHHNVKGRTKEDEEFARLKKEIDKKKGRVDSETSQRIAEQTELRARLRVAVEQVQATLACFASMAEERGQGMADVLPVLLPSLLPLLTNPLVKAAAAALHRSLLRCVDSHVRSLSLPLALSVQLLVVRGVGVWEDKLLVAMLTDVLKQLAARAKQRVLSAPTWAYVSPLVSAVLLQSKEPEGGEGEQEEEGGKGGADDDEDEDDGEGKAEEGAEVEGHRPGFADALTVLTSLTPASLHTGHTSATVLYPLTDFLHLLLHLLNATPSCHTPVSSALLSVAPALSLSELSPLLTDAGVFSVNVDVRTSTLDALLTTTPTTPSPSTLPTFTLLTYSTFILTHDADAEVKEAATDLFAHLALHIDADYLAHLLPFLSHPYPHVRAATSQAIAAALALHPSTTPSTLTSLLDLFRSSPDIRTHSRLRSVEVQSRWQTRDGVALTLHAATPSLSSPSTLTQLFTFFLSHALRDDHDTVWADVLNAGLALIQAHGATAVDNLLPLFTEYSALQDVGGDSDEHWRNDRVREGSVIFMGTIAPHMQSDSEDLLTVMSSLVNVLQTPSQSVQRAVAECIHPLLQHSLLATHAQSYLSTLLTRLSTGDDYAARRGAAFGIAAIIKGLRLQALRRYSILDRLSSLITDKSPKARQGALFLYERLFAELGSKFEPYTVTILPHLLTNFGDVNLEVREAAQDCAKVMMGCLTGYAVKQVLPLILQSLNESKTKAGGGDKETATSWRAKLESISLLGTMAHLNPQQLSTALPMIVPRLLDVMTDPNAKVQSSAKVALRQIGSVIRNPEIAAIVPVLLAALNDPSAHTKRALGALIHTSFVHSIDPPSLALIVPILRKGLKGRTAPTKKMAAQVVGSMCNLLGNVADLLPYAAILVKYVRDILVDPIPEVRTVAAKALGSLYSGIRNHDDAFLSLSTELLHMLHGDTTSVQRSGAAQGLAQVLMVEGMERTIQLMPQLYAETKNDKPVVREGYFNLLTALPDAFAEEPQFADLIEDIFPVIVAGLADETGLVREAALAAGQALILHYATSQTELLLPALESGLVAEDWRIRLSSVQLIGLLILRLAGLSGKYLMGLNMALEEDEDGGVKESTTITTREQEVDVENALGVERRNRVFALMYLLRSDVVSGVREMGWRVWKGCVTSTPRMLSTVLPTLMDLVIFDLSSASAERQHAAQAALGELVGKLGESVLMQIIPILQQRLDSDDEHTRQGVCLGVSEVIKVARKSDIAQYFNDLIPSIRDALCDTSTLVRQAAGRAFMTLFKQVHKRAIEEIIPALIEQLDDADEDDEQAQLTLGGIREVLLACNEQVLPYLLPVLAASPLTLFHTKALAALSEQLGKGMQRYIASLTSALVESLAREREESVRLERAEAASRIVQCVQLDSVGVFFDTLTMQMLPSEERKVKIAACQVLQAFVSHTKVFYDSNLPVALQAVLTLWNDDDVDVVNAAWDAMDTLSRFIADTYMSRHIAFIRNVLSSFSPAPTPSTPLHGLTVKKGIAPLLPAFQYALLHGIPAQRVSASDGLGELVLLSSEATLAPHVIKLTGPLIRIVGDRFPAEVKASILHTLHLLITKCGRLLKPFLPQLQTTFIKHCQDTDAIVRTRAAAGLADLMQQSARVEVVVNELLAIIAGGAAGEGVVPSVYTALSLMLEAREVGGKISPDVRAKVAASAATSLAADDDATRKEAGHCLADTLTYLSPPDLHSQLDLLLSPTDAWQGKAGQALALAYVGRASYDVVEPVDRDAAVQHLQALLKDDHEGVIEAATISLGEWLTSAGRAQHAEVAAGILPSFTPLLSHPLPSFRQLAASRLQLFASAYPTDLPPSTLDLLIPALLPRMTDTNGPARRAAQAALYFLLSFQHGTDRAERAINVHIKAMSKRGEGAHVQALMASARRAIVRMEEADLRVQDELRRTGAGGGGGGAGGGAAAVEEEDGDGGGDD